ncbi:hypothetical protein BE61_p0890 (plasmid) [Bradyrhizobium elkanii USDA 61]|nr:hypothetical protein BE61_p0890 [Bradyrhizobium elkanii USDA 61]
MRALPSVRSDATPSPDATDGASKRRRREPAQRGPSGPCGSGERRRQRSPPGGSTYEFEHCALPELDLWQVTCPLRCWARACAASD